MHPIIKNTARGLGLALALLATAGLARAAGFAIYENDARGFAMANANVGRNDDASALYSNPAAITQLPGFQIKAGITFIQPEIDVTTFGSLDGQIPAGVPVKNSLNSYTAIVPHLYMTYRITDDIGLGLGFFVPYGLKSDFARQPISWPGAYNNFYTDIKSYEITPTIAYRIVHDQPWAKQISIAAGLAALRTDIVIKRQMLLGVNPITGGPLYSPLTLDGGTWQWGYNLAIQYEVNNQLSFGIVYRSGFKLKINDASATIDPITGGLFPGMSSNNASGKINLPDSWSFGVNYSPIIPLNLGFQALRTNWGSYDKLTINPGFEGRPTPEPVQKQWRDVWRYCFGAEYQINNQVALRGGFVVDKDPVNPNYADYMVPSNDRQIFTIGAGWTINKNVGIDIALGYIKIKGRHINARPADGVLETNVHTGNAKILSVSGNFRF